jgi:hypothetical protein
MMRHCVPDAPRQRNQRYERAATGEPRNEHTFRPEAGRDPSPMSLDAHDTPDDRACVKEPIGGGTVVPLRRDPAEPPLNHPVYRQSATARMAEGDDLAAP